MKKILFWLGLFLLCLFGETVVFPRLLPLGFRPDLLIVVAVITAIFSDWIVGGIFCIAVSLVSDVMTGLYVGLQPIAYLGAIVLIGLFAKRHFANNIVFAVLAAFVGLWVKELIMAFLIRFCGGTASLGSALLLILTASLMTAVLILPVYFVRSRMVSGLRSYRKRY